jgi:hypothetical protein
MRNLNIESSWLERVEYVPLAAGVSREGWVKPSSEGGEAFVPDGFLVAKTKQGDEYAWACESWVAGLVVAHKSPGRAMRLLVIGKWPSVKLNGGSEKGAKVA